MGQQYPYSTSWEKSRILVLHINRAKARFLLLLDHQDTESESSEIEMSISQLTFTQRKKKMLHGTIIYIIYNMGENILTILIILDI